MLSFDDYLREAELAHGHLCAGQVLGVRLAMLGLENSASKIRAAKIASAWSPSSKSIVAPPTPSAWSPDAVWENAP